MKCLSKILINIPTPLLLLLLFLFLPVYSTTAQEWTKYPGNPIFSGQAGNWDSYHVHNPSIIKRDNKYEMWYEANGGLGWRIGYASSEDGLFNWTRTSEPVIPPSSLDGWEKETAEPLSSYFPDNQVYKMWFTSVNTTSWMVGADRFRTRYAFSANGTTWNIAPTWTLTGSLNSWDAGGTYKSKSLIYRDGVYHLWYAGTDESNLTVSPFWRIGYATSPDGLTWTKQNSGNPVITPTEPWELGNVSFPTVILDNGVYHMWYATGMLDNPTKLVYAYSVDGINWTKPADLNPVLMGTPGGFDQNIITVSTVLKEDDQLKMWYSGFDGTHWRIGYATADASILPTPPATPTPEPTPTLTPTPTPTSEPTATPTPPQTTKTVVIPGLGGSWNPEALLLCKLDGYNGNWTSWSAADPIYNPILQALTPQGFSPTAFYYDWRKPITENAPKLTTFINTVDSENVHIVGHSMGGLVARAYIEQQQAGHKIDTLITAGSPHRGTLLAYSAWSGGKIEGDMMWRIAAELMKTRCGGLFSKGTETLRTVLPSVQNLLPTFDYLKKTKTNTFIPASTMLVKNNWLPTTFSPPFYDATVKTVSGTGIPTLEWFTVKDPNKPEVQKGIWLDGKSVESIMTSAGDGTVLASSSKVEGAENITISQSHNGIIASEEGVNTILSLLADTQVSVTTPPFAEPETALFLASYPGMFWVDDPNGKTSKDYRNQVTYLNPKKGTYKLRLIPTSGNTKFIVGQFLKNGKTIWKEYSLKNILPKFKSIQFDPQNPLENPLN